MHVFHGVSHIFVTALRQFGASRNSNVVADCGSRDRVTGAVTSSGLIDQYNFVPEQGSLTDSVPNSKLNSWTTPGVLLSTCTYT